MKSQKLKKFGYLTLFLSWIFLIATILIHVHLSRYDFLEFLKDLFRDVINGLLLYMPHLIIIVVCWLFIKKIDTFKGRKKALLMGSYCGSIIVLLCGLLSLSIDLFLELTKGDVAIFHDGTSFWGWQMVVFYFGLLVLILGSIIGTLTSWIIQKVNRSS